MSFALSLFGGLEGRSGQGFRLFWLLDHRSSARWPVPKFAKKNFQSIYKKHIHFHLFCVYTWLASVENAEVVQVGCGAVWAVQARRITKGQGSALIPMSGFDEARLMQVDNVPRLRSLPGLMDCVGRAGRSFMKLNPHFEIAELEVILQLSCGDPVSAC